MKKLAILVVATIVSAMTITAQNYMVVDSKKIFESLEEYTQALETIDAEGEEYQKSVDAKFDYVESMYNNYTLRANSLSSSERATYESRITELENKAIEYQESIFSSNGVLMKRRLELLAPIQTKVFEAIEVYAKRNKFDLVLDETSNATILYKSEAVDHTQGVIMELKR